jgi:hypothetical protein
MLLRLRRQVAAVELGIPWIKPKWLQRLGTSPATSIFSLESCVLLNPTRSKKSGTIPGHLNQHFQLGSFAHVKNQEARSPRAAPKSKDAARGGRQSSVGNLAPCPVASRELIRSFKRFARSHSGRGEVGDILLSDP